MSGITVAAAVGTGMVAGLLFAFSVFVMTALDRLGSDRAAAAMQSINEVILNPVFFVLFIGTALLSLVLMVGAPFSDADEAGWRALGGGLYIVGVMFVTASRNVPMNNRLAEVDALAPEITAEWARYHRDWTRWNHVRALCSLLAAALSIHLLMHQG